jgi:hypothetical protein
MGVLKPTRCKSMLQRTDETWVDHEKYAETNTHEDETNRE